MTPTGATDIPRIASIEPTCGGCGYSLIGHESSGRCPECGETFSPDTLILWGAEGAPFQADRIARNLQLGWAAIVFGLFIMLVWKRSATVNTGLFQSIAPAAVWMGLVVWLLWVGKRRRQVRLTSQGFAARLGPGAVKIKPWSGDDEVDLRRIGPNAYLFTIRQHLSVPVQMNLACADEEVERLRLQLAEITHRSVGLER